MDLKYRSFVTEIKGLTEEKDNKGVPFGFFEGYAATFGNMDRVDDVIEKGAFSKTLDKGRRIKLLWQHSESNIIGSIMEAKEDDQGLFIKGRINLGTEQGREAYALLKAGDIDEMSIGFAMKRSDYEYGCEDDDSSKKQVRKIKSLTLYEISLVTEPANTEAVVTDVKKLTEDIDGADSLSDMEEILREKGFSKKQACGVVSKIKKFLVDDQGDPEEKSIKKEVQPEQGEPDDTEVVQQLNAALTEIKLHSSLIELKGK